MTRVFSALILDDDPDAANFLRWKLEQHFPWVRVATSETAEVYHGFDMYFIDNDFGGSLRAAYLARELREKDPDALIVAFSGVMPPETLKSLINAGCDGACAKDNPADLAVLLRKINEFIHGEAEQKSDHATGLRGAIGSVSQMLSRWDQHLARQTQVGA